MINAEFTTQLNKQTTMPYDMNEEITIKDIGGIRMKQPVEYEYMLL